MSALVAIAAIFLSLAAVTDSTAVSVVMATCGSLAAVTDTSTSRTRCQEDSLDVNPPAKMTHASACQEGSLDVNTVYFHMPDTDAI